MATTTNYAWETPDDTDLVKDGAAAIRTLGSSVDTTTKALNPSTTLGDVEYRSATANTNTRLPIGTSGQVLTVNGGVPSWQTASSGGMTLISTTTLTGASVTLSSIPSTFTDLRLVIRNPRTSVDGEQITFRFNGDSGTRYSRLDYNAASVTQTFNVTAFEDIIYFIDNTTSSSLVTINIPDYTNTTTWKMTDSVTVNTNHTTPTSVNIYKVVGCYNQTAAVSSISIHVGSGTLSAGTALLYGVK